MKPRFLLALFFAGLSFGLYACAPKYAITTSHNPIQIGDTTVDFVIHEASVPGLTYFNLHDNENTSVKAALDLIGEVGGRIIELKHSGDRNITFHLGGNLYEFDPNRMFTNAGRVATLERFSLVTDEALAAVKTFSEEVLQQLNPTELDVLVTLHNTSQSYSVLVYADGGDLAGEAEDLYISGEMDPNDYYFVIDRTLFEQLKQMDQNVVLQDNVGATDDGSLSVWFAQRNINYANVEAQNGHRHIQKDMLQHLHEILYVDR